MKIDKWTLDLEKLLLDIAKAANENSKKYYFGGGFSLDLLLGKLTRSHEDIDFLPLEKDTQWWRDWFESKGFILSKDPDMDKFPNVFKVTDEKDSYYVDVWPIKIGTNGEILWLTKDGSYLAFSGHSYKETKTINYKGIPLVVEYPENIINQKIKHSKEFNIELSEKHKHDLRLFKKYKNLFKKRLLE